MKFTLIALVLVLLGIVLVFVISGRRKPTPVTMVDPKSLSFSQLDITETFGDNLRLGENDWVETVPLNSKVPNPVGAGLPAPSAGNDEVYTMAAKLSALREQIPGLSDGVYCPVCHIANREIRRLKNPCPKCSRPLLKFGWE